MLYDYHNFTEVNLQNERKPPILDEQRYSGAITGLEIMDSLHRNSALSQKQKEMFEQMAFGNRQCKEIVEGKDQALGKFELDQARNLTKVQEKASLKTLSKFYRYV
jgi:hypothetical protein